MIIIDTSVWLDLFIENSERKELAENLMRSIDECSLVVYEPEVFKVLEQSKEFLEVLKCDEPETFK